MIKRCHLHKGVILSKKNRAKCIKGFSFEDQMLCLVNFLLEATVKLFDLKEVCEIKILSHLWKDILRNGVHSPL